MRRIDAQSARRAICAATFMAPRTLTDGRSPSLCGPAPGWRRRGQTYVAVAGVGLAHSMKGREILGVAASAWLASALAGCGGSGGSGGGSSALDLPTIVSLGGPVLATPRLQPIYFPGFPFAAETDAFLANLAKSQYWTEAVGEYGVGAPVALPGNATMVAAPPSLGAQDVSGLLMSVLAADAAKLGAAQADTLYVLMLPPTTHVVVGSVMFCGTGPSGFHAEVNLGPRVAVAVLPTCSSFAGESNLTGFAAIAPALTHEIVEAAADPLVTSAPAFARTDDGHPMWPIVLHGGEVADLCENESPNRVSLPELGQPVPRVWSNVAARAGRDPCVPAPSGGGYFTTVARLPEMVQVQMPDGRTIEVPAVVAAVGASATVMVDFHGLDGAPASWGAVALEYHGDAALMQTLMGMQIVPVTGKSGDTKTLPVITPAETSAGVFPLVIISRSPGDGLHLWIGTIVRR
jgi:hypothetical protein